MSNVIQIKHGTNKPADGILQPYELGYADNDGLFIGNKNGNTAEIKVGHANKAGQASNADKAQKLSESANSDELLSVGDTNQPVYFKDGVPKGCGTIDEITKRVSLDVDVTGEATKAKWTDRVMKMGTSGLFEETVLIFEAIYPIGSIYISTVEKNPHDLFSFGTWVRIEGQFLLGAGDTYPAGDTGGEASVTLTEAQMPSHRHQVTDNEGSQLNYNNSGQSGSGNFAISGGVDWNNMWTSNVGGDQPHNNMPPYLAVYMWQRTA